MADDFFGFATDFPRELGMVGKHDIEDDLSADAEEEYDALNDETFGQAANDDWEEAHEKLSELIKNNNIDVKSYFKDSLIENDDSQEQIVSKSISQLGLEDDLDDPAIMTVSRNCQPSSRLRSVFSSSPPPPAILETEIYGSPKTHSIWSTTPKDSGVSFLQSLSHSPSSLSQQESRPSLNSTDSVFTTPQKLWRAEDLERDMLSTSSNEQSSSASSNSWSQSPQIIASSNQNLSNKLASHRFSSNANHYHNKMNQRVFTREEVERQMHSDSRISFQNKVGNLQSPLPSHILHPNIPPIGSASTNNLNAHLQPSPPMPFGIRGPMIRGALDNPLLMPLSNGLHPRNMLNYRMRPDYMLHNSAMGGVINPFMGLPRPINHPLMPNWKPPVFSDKQYDNENYRNGMPIVDEYAGLMTQREKDWLIKIQLLLLKSENPYVEDYYYTTQLTRKFKKKFSENPKKGGGDAPELILPETSKSENKTYVPTQFEGSLGKLQAVSVNFPRKVLDIKVTRPLEDDEGRIVTNQCLMKYRRLLIDIEKLYTSLLEIEDEEKRILAKPDTGEAPHRENIAALTLKIYNGLCSDNVTDDNFQNIMTIRKGRNLVVRVFPLFSKEQQLQCLSCICRSLSLILKKDQNDLVLVRNYKTFTDSIKNCSLPDLVQLGEALGNGMCSESSKEKNFVAAFKHKFGSSVICSMIKKAEDLYSGFDLFESDIQTKWANIVLNIVDIVCNLEKSTLLNPPLMPFLGLVKHFQRFAVEQDKLEILKEKLEALETNSKDTAQNDV